MEIQFIPLTFIQEKGDVQKQVENTAIFSVLQKKYPMTTLGDYLEDTQYGYTASALESGNCHMLRITDINNGRVKWNKVPFCNCDTLEKYRLKQNDILVARTGWTTWKSFLVEDISVDAVFASYLIRLRPKKDVVPDFLYAFLNSYLFWSQITEMKGWSAQPNVNAEKLKTVKIPQCDIETQKLVVKMISNSQGASIEFKDAMLWARKVFETIFETQTEHTQQSDLLSSLRSAILREAVQGKLVPQDLSEWNARDLLNQIRKEREQSINEKRSKKMEIKPIDPSEIPFEIPKSWAWCRLGELVTNLGQTTPDSEFFYIDVWSIDNSKWRIRYDSLLKIRPEDSPSRARKIVAKWSIIYSTVRPYLLNTSIVDVELDRQLIASTAFAVLSPFEWVELKYLHNLLRSKIMIDFVMEKQWGQAYPAITEKELLNAPIPLPPHYEQIRVAQKIDELTEKFKGLETSIAESKSLSERLLKVGLKEVFNS